MVVAVDGEIFVHATSVVCGGLEISIYFGFRGLCACVENEEICPGLKTLFSCAFSLNGLFHELTAVPFPNSIS